MSSAAVSAARPQPDVAGMGVGVGCVPPDLRATVCPIPAAIADQLVDPVDSWVGVVLSTLLPSPSLPCPFEPQAQRVPSDLRATAW